MASSVQRDAGQLEVTSSYDTDKEANGKKWSLHGSVDITSSEIHRQLDWVIFPDNKWIKKWDYVVLLCLFLLTFILPYQIGVSAGRRLITNIPWLVFNVFINSIFFVDTFIYFFRAYRNKTGALILNPRKIRRQYLRTYFIPNFLSVLPFTLMFHFRGISVARDMQDDKIQDIFSDEVERQTEFISFLNLLNILKLVRLVRVKSIFASSDAITQYRLRHNSQVVDLNIYFFIIVVVSHWFACFWAMVAYLEARTITDDMLHKQNWISNWYNSTYADGDPNGGLNPIGWYQDVPRYALSLFWAIQTITSIGYGNILPATDAEYFVACFLQLCAGVMWAYVIAGLVGVASTMWERTALYHARTDQANDLIREFSDVKCVGKCDSGLNQEKIEKIESDQIGNSIRLYIHKQYKISNTTKCASQLSDAFPVYDSLTPKLKQMASLLVFSRYVEAVPYLSSRYLSTNEQCKVTMKCVMLEFAAGDIINLSMLGLGPGIFILKSGCAIGNAVSRSSLQRTYLLTKGMVAGAGRVLIEDGNPISKETFHFVLFSKVIFIPRAAVLSALENNERAWKECARWVYFKTLLREKHRLSRETA